MSSHELSDEENWGLDDLIDERPLNAAENNNIMTSNNWEVERDLLPVENLVYYIYISIKGVLKDGELVEPRFEWVTAIEMVRLATLTIVASELSIRDLIGEI